MNERLVLSISDVKQYMECPQKFMYRYVDQVGPAGSASSALLVGTLVHKMLEGKLRDPAFDCAGFLASLEFGDEYAQAEEETKEETYKTLLGLLPALEIWAPQEKWEIVDVEKELRTTLRMQDGSEVELVGRLDCVVRAMGKLWHLQHKTVHASKPCDVYSEYVKTDWHEVAYQQMAAEAYTGEQYGGTILNCIRKLSGKRIAAAPSDVFALYYLHRGADLVSSAWSDIQNVVDRMAWDITAYQLGMAGLKNRLACAGIFGNSLCPYKDVCDGRRPLDAMGFVKIEPRYAASQEGD